MEPFGIALTTLALFVSFGFMIGVLFGFFGMGGSFLVTPALLVMGYPARVAVGSGMAFVFGTAVIATLKHHDLGQVDYKLGGLMIAGTTAGIEVGSLMVYRLEEFGLAGGVIGVTYVGLLGSIGLFVTRNALKNDDNDGFGGDHHDATDAESDPDAIPDLAKTIQSYHVPPMMTIAGGIQVSLWMVLGVAFATGLLSGFLGVGGGFIRMPAMFYLIGVPVPVAVGTDLFEIVFSGGFGAFTYGMNGGVDLSIVAPLLAGSALGARIGSAATGIVDEDDIKIYFGLMLLGGSIAVAFQQAGDYFAIAAFNRVGFALILLSAFVVSGAVIYSTIAMMRKRSNAAATSAD
ncbi:sulfite exporter TauE/SafE family protein [Haloterrigena sp. SYSU A121-1]|uniref:Probable membrane transporter protein n=1 Tax=Haloterrigena gelatinilytica TaxID=2741724 RepID=A0A8J8KGM2_9EURY|nr:sulfite exporter TauE/SafE family protein [Haloterrigena gelatinilytica]NUB93568.1 sulfite exporter TauE/SafE family protein [Haloterrigena gelatinilytica]